MSFNGRSMNVGENLDEKRNLEKAPILLVLIPIGFASFNGGSLERKS
jgi:hypothetical protein